MTHWVLLAALHLGGVQLEAGLRNEERVAFVPLVSSIGGPQGAPTGSAIALTSELRPNVRFHLVAHGTDLLLTYTPSLMVTHAFGTTQALPLQTATLAYLQRLDRTFYLTSSGGGTIGKLDFFRARRLLSADTPTVLTIPENATLGYASGNAYLGIGTTIGHFAKAEVGGLLLHTGPAPGEKTFLFFRRQDQAGTSGRFIEQLTRNDSATLEIEYKRIWFQRGPYYKALTPAAIYKRTWAGGMQLELKAGLLLSSTAWGSANSQTPQWLIGEGLLPPRTGTEHRYLPVLSAILSGFQVRTPGFYWQSGLTVNLLPFWDPVNSVLQQRVGFGWNNNVAFSRRWRGRLNLQVLSPAHWEFSKTIQPFVDQDFYAILNPAVQRYVAQRSYFELGFYLTQRLEDYTQIIGHWYQPELILYLAFQGQSTVW